MLRLGVPRDSHKIKYVLLNPRALDEWDMLFESGWGWGYKLQVESIVKDQVYG